MTHHNHTLDHSDQNYACLALKQVAAQEVANGYAPATIYNTLTGHTGLQGPIQKAVEASGGRWFLQQAVINAGRGFKSLYPDPRLVGHDFQPPAQMEAVHEFLSTQSSTQSGHIIWFHERVTATREIDGKPSIGIVFASSAQLEVLRRRGRIVLMDATHKTNWLGWLLYTILVRDEQGSWLPVCHLLTEEQDGDIIAVALYQIRS